MSTSRLVELLGGPCDGQRMPVADDAETLLFHNEPMEGMTSAYRVSERTTRDGLTVFKWTGTSGEAHRPDPA